MLNKVWNWKMANSVELAVELREGVELSILLRKR